jgi:hemolysin III
MRRYYAGELEADFAVHFIGTITGAIGATVLLALAAASANTAVFLSVLVYGIGLVAMLVFSAAYHLQRSSRRRDLLRRLDHAAIFVMIAGTYTPFTVCTLNSSSAVWLTGPMWLAALAGVVLKLACPHWSEWASTAVYLAMGWAAVIFMQPLLAALDGLTLVLLLSGGVLYSVGACIHGWRQLPFHDAIWHGFVLGAAGLHCAAILHGVVLSPQ